MSTLVINRHLYHAPFSLRHAAPLQCNTMDGTPTPSGRRAASTRSKRYNMAVQEKNWMSYYFGDYARHFIVLLPTVLLVMAACSLHGKEYSTLQDYFVAHIIKIIFTINNYINNI